MQIVHTVPKKKKVKYYPRRYYFIGNASGLCSYRPEFSKAKLGFEVTAWPVCLGNCGLTRRARTKAKFCSTFLDKCRRPTVSKWGSGRFKMKSVMCRLDVGWLCIRNRA